VLCAGTLPLTVLWSAIYLAVGAPLGGRDPRVLFSLHPDQHGDPRTHPQSQRLPISQLFLILILPWLVTMSLAGFKPSSVVIIWAALCSIGALLLDELRRTFF
jgi:adenylate cyclase